MAAPQVTYRYESTLVDDFCRVLQTSDSPWGEVALAREFCYSRGCTDVVAVNPEGQLLAFEAKIVDWRSALHQAYRNTSFAHFSYVLLPQEAARKAALHSYEFDRRAVGLCYLVPDAVVVLLTAKHQEPIQPWLSELATQKIQEVQ